MSWMITQIVALVDWGVFFKILPFLTSEGPGDPLYPIILFLSFLKSLLAIWPLSLVDFT
jgi:hypothetical protein